MSKSDQAKAREHRLALKLRENLRRRKEPAAATPAGESSQRPQTAPSEDDEPRKP